MSRMCPDNKATRKDKSDSRQGAPPNLYRVHATTYLAPTTAASSACCTPSALQRPCARAQPMWGAALPTALLGSVSPVDLVGSGRDAEAAEQLRGAIALRPFDADAYRLLGGLLGERWERRALRTRSTDFGVRESDVPEPELRAEAVDALANSVQLQPSAHVHAVIGSLLTPNGRAATAHDMQQAVDHLQAALTLDPSVHAGTIDVAQRLSFQRHMMVCNEVETAAAERRSGSSLVAASSRMGELACAAYHQWARLQPQHGEVNRCRPHMPSGCICLCH